MLRLVLRALRLRIQLLVLGELERTQPSSIEYAITSFAVEAHQLDVDKHSLDVGEVMNLLSHQAASSPQRLPYAYQKLVAPCP